MSFFGQTTCDKINEKKNSSWTDWELATSTKILEYPWIFEDYGEKIYNNLSLKERTYLSISSYIFSFNAYLKIGTEAAEKNPEKFETFLKEVEIPKILKLYSKAIESLQNKLDIENKEVKS